MCRRRTVYRDYFKVGIFNLMISAQFSSTDATEWTTTWITWPISFGSILGSTSIKTLSSHTMDMQFWSKTILNRHNWNGFKMKSKIFSNNNLLILFKILQQSKTFQNGWTDGAHESSVFRLQRCLRCRSSSIVGFHRHMRNVLRFAQQQCLRHNNMDNFNDLDNCGKNLKSWRVNWKKFKETKVFELKENNKSSKGFRISWYLYII